MSVRYNKTTGKRIDLDAPPLPSLKELNQKYKEYGIEYSCSLALSERFATRGRLKSGVKALSILAAGRSPN